MSADHSLTVPGQPEPVKLLNSAHGRLELVAALSRTVLNNIL